MAAARPAVEGAARVTRPCRALKDGQGVVHRQDRGEAGGGEIVVHADEDDPQSHDSSSGGAQNELAPTRLVSPRMAPLA